MLPPMNSTTLMAAHNEQVTKMPAQAVCLGGSDFCPFASMQVGENIWTTQYHPEMPLDFMQVLLEHLSGKLDSSTIEHARGSLSNIADASIFAQWMVNFIESRKANNS
jgi:GMP synthase (glutamine-hydrolysing)